MWPLFLEAMEGYNWRCGDIIGYHLTLKGGPTLRYVCNTKITILFNFTFDVPPRIVSFL